MHGPGDTSEGLERFLEAQAAVYPAVLEELGAGCKRSHWMWFIFPQIAGLGFSATSRHFAIRGRIEAQAYLAHPVLGHRLLECTGAVMQLQKRDLSSIFGFPDDLKFCSCMTLFSRLSPPGSLFEQALEKYCNGEPDQQTIKLLNG